MFSFGSVSAFLVARRLEVSTDNDTKCHKISTMFNNYSQLNFRRLYYICTLFFYYCNSFCWVFVCGRESQKSRNQEKMFCAKSEAGSFVLSITGVHIFLRRLFTLAHSPAMLFYCQPHTHTVWREECFKEGSVYPRHEEGNFSLSRFMLLLCFCVKEMKKEDYFVCGCFPRLNCYRFI